MFKIAVFITVLWLLTQPETWHLWYLLDGTSLDALALLLEAQVLAFLGVVCAWMLRPALEWLGKSATACVRSLMRNPELNALASRIGDSRIASKLYLGLRLFYCSMRVAMENWKNGPALARVQRGR